MSLGVIVQSNLLYNRFILQGTIKQQIFNFRPKIHTHTKTKTNTNKPTNNQSNKQTETTYWWKRTVLQFVLSHKHKCVQLFVSCFVSCVTVSLLDAMRLVVILFTELTPHDTNSCTSTICMWNCQGIKTPKRQQDLICIPLAHPHSIHHSSFQLDYLVTIANFSNESYWPFPHNFAF